MLTINHFVAQFIGVLFTWLYITRVEDAISDYEHYQDGLLGPRNPKQRGKLAKWCKCMPEIDWVFDVWSSAVYASWQLKWTRVFWNMTKILEDVWLEDTVCSFLVSTFVFLNGCVSTYWKYQKTSCLWTQLSDQLLRETFFIFLPRYALVCQMEEFVLSKKCFVGFLFFFFRFQRLHRF